MSSRAVPLEPLPDVVLLEPQVHRDARGLFLEWFRASDFAGMGLPDAWAQANHSRSASGVIRGLHFQHPHGQGKLVRSVRGAILDVAVDVRRGSPTFGRWVGARLDDAGHRLLYVPPGFAHGFAVTEGPADVTYLCTVPYAPECEHALAWDDPEIGVDWGIRSPTVSERDRGAPTLAELRDAGALPTYEPRAP